MYGIDTWFCCLPDAERAILRQCVTSFEVTLGQYIPCEIFDALWLFVPLSREARKDAFLLIYGLTQEEIVIPPSEEPTCVYTFDDPAFWIALGVYTLTPAGACLDGCQIWYPA